MTDGVSCTILFGERSHRELRWRFMGFQFPSQQDFAVFARWYTGGTYTGRQPLEGLTTTCPSGWRAIRRRWTHRVGATCTPSGLAATEVNTAAGATLVMADGSIRFVAEYISLATLHALATKSGGEMIATE